MWHAPLARMVGLLLMTVHVGYADKKALLQRQEQHLAVVAAAEATAAALVQAVEDEKIQALERLERAAKAKLKRKSDQERFTARLEKSTKDAKKKGDFSIKASSPTFHVTNYFQIKPKVDDAYCMTVPRADNFIGLRNGLAVILAPCEDSDPSQLFARDPSSKYIHPEGNVAFCLDSDFDSQDLRPLTVFRCDKTFSAKAAPRHQEWEFSNGSFVKNVGADKCLATGKAASGQLYDGKAVQQYGCAEITEQSWNWVPIKWYKAKEPRIAFHEFHQKP